MRIFHFTLFLVFGLLPSVLWAQIAGSQGDAFPVDSMSADNIDQPLYDSSKAQYRYWGQPSYSRRLIDTQLQHFNRLRTGWGEQDEFALMNMDFAQPGSPVRPFLFRTPLRQGLRLGFEAFEPFRLSAERLRIYDIEGNRPISDLYYSQINQRNSSVEASFAHQVQPKFYYSVHYSLLNYGGFYQLQNLRNNNLALSMGFESKSGRYKGHFHALSYSVRRNEYGGIAVDDLDNFGNIGTAFLLNTPVQSDSGRSSLGHIELLYKQQLLLGKAKKTEKQSKGTKIDSLGRDSLALSATDSLSKKEQLLQQLSGWYLGHSISYEQQRFLFYDRSPRNSDFYGNLLTNPRGLRHALALTSIGNSIELESPDSRFFNLHIWLRHKLHILRQEPQDFLIQDFFVGGRISGLAGKDSSLYYRGEGQFGRGDGRANAYLWGDIRYRLGKWFALEAEARLQNYSPSRIEQQVYISGQQVWDENQNLLACRDWQLMGRLAVPKTRSKIELAYIGLDNPIFFRGDGTMQQSSEAHALLQVGLRQDFKLGPIYSSHHVYLQQYTGEALRLPELLQTHSIAFQKRIFDAMDVKFGFQMRWWSAHALMGYSPALAQFTVQDDFIGRVYPLVDALVSFRLYRFRFFFNAENLLQVIAPARFNNYSPTHLHSSPNFLLRFGLSWQLLD